MSIQNSKSTVVGTIVMLFFLPIFGFLVIGFLQGECDGNIFGRSPSSLRWILFILVNTFNGLVLVLVAERTYADVSES